LECTAKTSRIPPPVHYFRVFALSSRARRRVPAE
jgi:hypothetical protein